MLLICCSKAMMTWRLNPPWLLPSPGSFSIFSRTLEPERHKRQTNGQTYWSRAQTKKVANTPWLLSKVIRRITPASFSQCPANSYSYTLLWKHRVESRLPRKPFVGVHVSKTSGLYSQVLAAHRCLIMCSFGPNRFRAKSTSLLECLNRFYSNEIVQI